MPIRLPISIKNSINTNIEDKINDVNLTAKKTSAGCHPADFTL